MKAKLERDLRLRKQFKGAELNSVALKALLYATSLPKPIRQYLQLKNSVTRQSSIVRIHNYCTITGRSRSYLRYFRLSRIKVRELARKGALFGIQKASW